MDSAVLDSTVLPDTHKPLAVAALANSWRWRPANPILPYLSVPKSTYLWVLVMNLTVIDIIYDHDPTRSPHAGKMLSIIR